jgi:hypothetical protein
MVPWRHCLPFSALLHDGNHGSCSGIADSHVSQQTCETWFKFVRISLCALQSFATVYSTAPAKGTVFNPHDWTVHDNAYEGELLGQGSVCCYFKHHTYLLDRLKHFC